MLIEDILAEDTVTETNIDILSGSILGEAQQAPLTGLAVTHMEDTLDLLSRRLNETTESMDEEDSTVSQLQSKVLL